MEEHFINKKSAKKVARDKTAEIKKQLEELKKTFGLRKKK